MSGERLSPEERDRLWESHEDAVLRCGRVVDQRDNLYIQIDDLKEELAEAEEQTIEWKQNAIIAEKEAGALGARVEALEKTIDRTLAELVLAPPDRTEGAMIRHLQAALDGEVPACPE